LARQPSLGSIRFLGVSAADAGLYRARACRCFDGGDAYDVNLEDYH